jgi:hypothetical protein
MSHATVRRPRHRSSLTSNVSSPVTFPQVDPSFPRAVNYNPPSSNSPTFAPSSAFFNITNGMTFSGPPDRSVTIPAESDISLGNPPMSPRADALLPSDLLGDEEPTDLLEPVTNAQYPDVGPAATQLESRPRGSPSPVSSEPRSASFFASPHGSLNHLRDTDHQPEEVPQGDSSSGVQSASRRLSGLFNFHRQRGKTLADGPPSLGTLKPGQSRSFPKNFDDMDPLGSRRRRLSYTGNWPKPISLFPRSANATADSSSDHIPSRRSAFASIFSSSKFGSDGSGDLLQPGSSDLNTGYNQFSPRHDPIDPSSILGTVRRGSLSPRPSSTFSFDKQLPHPSTDPFGWPSVDVAGQRSSLGFDWASPAAWSRTQSRRPSTQYGSSSHLPLGISATEPDFLQGGYEKQHRPLQAPIGTRPSSSHRPVTPKLNPAAPSFKTIFSKRSDRAKDKGKDSSSISKLQGYESNPDDISPPASRRSKDSRSLSAATDSYDSLDLVPSSSSVDNASTKDKESFIQKITRKSSSSKFNLSWKDRGGIFSKKNDSIQGDVDEDANSSEAQLGKSVDSIVSSTPSAEKSTPKNSRSFFTRKSKKSDQATSESSEKASETGDEEFVEEE